MPAPLEHILNEVWVFFYFEPCESLQNGPRLNYTFDKWVKGLQISSFFTKLSSRASEMYFFSFSSSFSVWLDQLILSLLNIWLAHLKGSALFLWFLLSQYLLKLLLQVCASVSYFTIFCLLNNSASNDRYGISPPDPQEL